MGGSSIGSTGSSDGGVRSSDGGSSCGGHCGAASGAGGILQPNSSRSVSASGPNPPHPPSPAALQGLPTDLQAIWLQMEQSISQMAADFVPGPRTLEELAVVQQLKQEGLTRAQAAAVKLGLRPALPVPAPAPPEPAAPAAAEPVLPAQ